MNQLIKKPFPGIKQTIGYLTLGIAMTFILVIIFGAIHGGVYAGLRSSSSPNTPTALITKEATDSFLKYTGAYTFIAVFLSNLILIFLELLVNQKECQYIFIY